ncbi:hypothetical protein [Streptomyces sp. NPDC126503]
MTRDTGWGYRDDIGWGADPDWNRRDTGWDTTMDPGWGAADTTRN